MIQMDFFSEYEENRPVYMERSAISGLFELSIDAFYAALYADMSELPIKAEIKRFIEKVKRAGNKISNDTGEDQCGKDSNMSRSPEENQLRIADQRSKIDHRAYSDKQQ